MQPAARRNLMKLEAQDGSNENYDFDSVDLGPK